MPDHEKSWIWTRWTVGKLGLREQEMGAFINMDYHTKKPCMLFLDREICSFPSAQYCMNLCLAKNLEKGGRASQILSRPVNSIPNQWLTQ